MKIINKMRLIKFLNWLYNFSIIIILMLGLMFACVILVAGIAHLPLAFKLGESTSSNLDKLTTGSMPYFLSAVFIIYIIGSVVIGIATIVKSFKKKKNQVINNSDYPIKQNQNKIVRFLKWWINN